MSTLLGDKIFRLTLSTTFLCNLKCSHCNIWKIYKDNPSLLKKELNPKEIEKIVETTKPLYIGVTGGEPLIKPGIPDSLESILEIGKDPHLISVNSNGYATVLIVSTAEKLADIADRIGKEVAFSISIDGPPDLHNKIRGVSDSYQRAVKTIKALKEISDTYKGFHVFVEYTVMEENLGSFPQTVKSLESNTGLRFKSDEFVINVVQASRYYNTESRHVDYTKFLQEIRLIRKFLSDKKIFDKSLSKHAFIQRAFLSKLELWLSDGYRHKCFAAEKSAFIDPFGDVYPCLPRYGVNKLGNVRDYDYDVTKILRSAIAKIFREKIRPKCNCWTPCESYTTLALRPYMLIH